MRLFQTLSKSGCFFIIMLILLSCNKDKEEVNAQKTSDFVPEVDNYEFFIEGEIDNKLLHYKQINYDWKNTSNKYFIESQNTWLQAYNDSVTREGGWWVRIHDIDIENIELPYTLKQYEGRIKWYDSRIDLIIEDTEYCHGVDRDCTFVLRPGKNNITITDVSSKIIEGTFKGKAILVRTGFTPGEDASLYHEIENGKFRINYRVE